jgi:hypothetical protein
LLLQAEIWYSDAVITIESKAGPFHAAERKNHAGIQI